MKDEAAYAGFSPNDCVQHSQYVSKTFDALQQGRLPLDLWSDNCCLGSPIFRSYQYLPHLLAAGLMKLTGMGAAQSVHFLIVFFWLLQFPAAYLACRLLAGNHVT